MRKKVLVIGSSGFIGRHLTRHLLEQGHEVMALQHRSPLQKQEGLHIIQGGIDAVTTEVINTFQPGVIFHCARPTFSRFRKYGRILAARLAARYNRNLLRQLSGSSQKPLLVFSSGSLLYGNSEKPHDEKSPLNPLSYARQYYKGEIPFIKAVERKTYPVMLLRLPWLLGNASWFKWFYLDSMQRKGAIPLFGDGQNMMEIADIRDITELMVKYGLEGPGQGTYNIPSGKAITQKEFAGLVSEIFGYPVQDYKALFPGKLEKEATEAFFSNILLGTHYPDLVQQHKFVPLRENLENLWGSL